MTFHLSADEVRSLLNYDPATGVFTWKVSRSHAVKIGDVAGSINSRGYRIFSFGRRWIHGHRLAWLYVHGRLPVDRIDHIDGSCDNNAIANLREVTATQNNWNHSRKGYFFRKKYGTYTASIQVNKKRIHLGTFAIEEDARAAYVAASIKYFGEFSAALSRPAHSTFATDGQLGVAA